MTKASVSLSEVLDKLLGLEGTNWLGEGVRWLAEKLMEAEVDVRVGARRHERRPDRADYRNGSRTRRWDTSSKSQVSRLCEDLDAQVEGFRNRPLTGSYPYLWVDAKYPKVRVDGAVATDGGARTGRSGGCLNSIVPPAPPGGPVGASGRSGRTSFNATSETKLHT